MNNELSVFCSNTPDALYLYAEHYLKKIWISKGCRFVAHRRLHRKSQVSQLAISLFSLSVIAATVSLPFIDPSDKKLAGFINVLAINASVFILVLSNLEFAKNYSVEAERMLHGALLLSKIHDDLELSIKTDSLTKEILYKIIVNYNQTLMDFDVNNEDIDYRCFQVDHQSRFPEKKFGCGIKFRYKILYYLHIWGLYLLCIVIPPILIYLAVRLVPEIDFLKGS